MQIKIPFPAGNFTAGKKVSLEIIVQDQYIKKIKYVLCNDTARPFDHNASLLEKNTAEKIKAEFLNYFKDPACLFTLQYQLDAASVFQQRVWKALTEIPSGEVRTYTALAKQLNSSPRAVGNACRVNPLPLIIPCHRVVSVSGIGGYAGDTLEKQKGSIDFVAIKLWLLDHERLLEHEKAQPG